MFTALIPALWIVVPAAPVPNAAGIPLPSDPTAVVIEFAHSGGFTPPVVNEKPDLTITADGTATANNRFSGDTATSKLTPAELQALLKFVVAENEFFGFDPAKVEKTLAEEDRKSGPAPAVADAADTSVTVRTAERTHKVSYYALSMAAEHYKNVKSLQQLNAVETRLNRVQSVVWAGGEAAVEGYLKQANEALKAKHPTAAPLTMDEFQYAGRNDGRLSLSFGRSDDAKGTFVSAQIEKPADGAAAVEVEAKTE